MNDSLTSPWDARTVTEVRDHGGVALRVTGADHAVALHAHGVAGGVQGLCADHDRVETEVVLAGVPAALVDAAEQAEQLERVDALAPGDTVLAVGREDVVLRPERAAGADLRGLLAKQRAPRCPARRGAGERWPRRRCAGSGSCRGRSRGPSRPGRRRPGRRRTRSRGAPTRSPSGVSSANELGAAVLVGRSEDLREVGAEAGLGHGRSLGFRLAGSPPACCRDGVRRGDGAPSAGVTGTTWVPPKLPGGVW